MTQVKSDVWQFLLERFVGMENATARGTALRSWSSAAIHRAIRLPRDLSSPETQFGPLDQKDRRLGPVVYALEVSIPQIVTVVILTSTLFFDFVIFML